MLAELRKQHGAQAREAQELLKQQQTRRRGLLEALQDGPRTVPQLAAATGLPAHEVLWHVAAMRKYGHLEEAGMDEDGDYYLYGRPKEPQS